MSALSIKPLVDRLHGAGLSLSLVSGGNLAVAPSSRLNDDLRALIRSHKADLVRWFSSTLNDPVPADPMQWHELARAYHAHHFSCTSCIAAGQGVGLRCGIGSALWRAYSLTPPPKNALNSNARSGKEENHE